MVETQHSRNDGKSGGRSQNDLKNLWSLYHEKSTFANSDLDAFLDNLKDKANTTEEYIESLRDEFDNQLKLAQKVAEKVVKRLSEKHGHLSDREVLHKVRSYQDQYKLSSPMMNAIIRYVQDYRSADPSVSTKGFNFKPIKSNAIGHMLGNPRIRTVGAPKITAEDHPYLKQILRLNTEHHHLFMALTDNTMRYKDCMFQKTARKFKSTFSQEDAVNPLFVALFGPKIRTLDWHFLLPSLSNIIKLRSEGRQPTTILEHQLLWHISHDTTSQPCTSDKSAMHDLLKRVKIQIALWQAVLNLRNGALYDPHNNRILAELYHCNPNTYMSPDMLINSDEHQLLERLFGAMSFKTIYMSTLPFIPHTNGQNSYNNPYWNPAIHAIATETVSIFTLRLPILPDGLDSVTEVNPIKLQEHLKHQDFFVDPTTRNIIPHNVHVVHCEGVFIVYINRNKASFNIHGIHRMRSPFHFNQLPVVDYQNRLANIYPVEVPENLLIGEHTKQTFKLRSMVIARTTVDTYSIDAVSKKMIAGSEAIVYPSDSSAQDIWKYSPHVATTLTGTTNGDGDKLYHDPVFEATTTPAILGLDETVNDIDAIRENLSKVLVYVDTNDDDLESRREFMQLP